MTHSPGAMARPRAQQQREAAGVPGERRGHQRRAAGARVHAVDVA